MFMRLSWVLCCGGKGSGGGNTEKYFSVYSRRSLTKFVNFTYIYIYISVPLKIMPYFNLIHFVFNFSNFLTFILTSISIRSKICPIEIVQRVLLHREHPQEAKIVVEKIIMRDKMFVLSCEKGLSVRLLLTFFCLYTVTRCCCHGRDKNSNGV